MIESYKLYKNPGSLDKEEKEKYKKYKENLKKYRIRATKRDFCVFRKHFINEGKDPSLIIPAYVTNNLLTPVLNPIDYRGYFEDKNMFDKILPKEYLPITRYRKMNGIWCDEAYKKILFDKVMEGLNALEGNARIIIKPSKDTSSGRGIKLLNKINGEWCEGKEDKKINLKKILENWGESDLIIQDVLQQADFFSQFCSTSVNTMRLVVYNSPVTGRCDLIWGGMRIGAKGSIVDNSHQGGMMIGINKDGCLYKFLNDQYGNRYTSFNGIDFDKQDFIIPNYSEIIKFTKEIAFYLLPHRFIAFDIMVDKKGEVKVIEFNLRGYSGWLCQMAGDPMYGAQTEEILEYITSHRKMGNKVFYSIS